VLEEKGEGGRKKREGGRKGMYRTTLRGEEKEA